MQCAEGNHLNFAKDISTRPFVTVAALVRREVDILWRYSVNDLSTSVMPGSTFSIVALFALSQRAPVTLLDFISVGAQAIIYFWLYILAFDITNQMFASDIEEDRKNPKKAHRPLAAGLVTVRGTWIRGFIAMALYGAMGIYYGFNWSWLWLGVIVVHNFLRLADYWWIKCLCMTLGTISMMSAAWEISGNTITIPVNVWIFTVSIYLFPTSSLQDLRDQVGDRTRKTRKTLPLLIGDEPARRFLWWAFTLSPIAIQAILLLGPWEVAILPGIMLLMTAINFGGNWWIAYRIWHLRTTDDDRRTYMMYTYEFVFYWAMSLGLFLGPALL